MSVAKENDGKDEGWIEWKGGECPVAYGTEVEIKIRDGDQFVDVAGLGGAWALDWSHGDHRDIIAYRIHKETTN